jgi:DNA-binding transcriptional LysR family regulator
MDRLGSMNMFLRVVERGSLSAAGRELALSPAAVSNHIRALEDWLGVRLLNRTTRQLTLTEAGQTFRERCETILAEVADAEAAAASLQAVPRGVLRVNAPIAFGVRHLAPVIAAYLDRYSETTLDLVLNDRVVDLIEEGFDVAIRIGDLADSELVARRLAPCRFVVCAAPHYLKHRGEPKHPAQLSDHHCLEYSLRAPPGRWVFTGPDGNDVAVTIAGRLRATNGDLLRSTAVQGLGVILAPTFIVGDNLRDGTLMQLLIGYNVRPSGIFAVYPAGRYPSPKLRSFVDFLADQIGAEPSWDQWCA